MKKAFLTLLIVSLGLSVMAQQKIQLRSADKAECVKSDMTSLKASFSFSTIEAEDMESERGTFSWLSMANTVIGGNEGDPQIPVVNQLIAVPIGASPRVEITSYSTTDYRLEDLNIHTLVPRQPSLRKDQRPEDVPFVYNADAYQTRGLTTAPRAMVTVEGFMRGIQLGKLGIEPVSYDPVNNTLRVFNDIEVTVHFDGADAAATEKLLVDTYSPYFNIVYKSLFNGRAVLDAYTQHPDLYTTPVKMLVVTTSTYANSDAFNTWLTWKKQKGIEVDVQTVTSSTSSSNVRSLIQSRYNANHPTFLVIIGDRADVTNYTTWSDNTLNYSPYVSDNAYASIDNDVYHDMFMSRMSVSSTTELGNLVNKIITYEKYTMTDPGYLNESLLIAGWDATWTNRVGKPTIQYANNNYFNTAHGITPHVYITTGTGQTTCYNYINQVGFVNYTAHGDITMLADPQFKNSQVSSMTNNGKYLWLVANCCLTANWGNSSTCLGETMIRAANKGAFGYIGSIPESYWYEDYYFGVGAFPYVAQTVQTPSSTTMGMYDAMFDETGFNTLNAMPYIGNVAVTYAHAAGYTSSVSDEYYWRGYQCLGDGSVMPYIKVPAANNVSHASTLPLSVNSFTVSADAGSYVSITVNNEIIGVAQVPESGTVNVPIIAQNTVGTAMIVVTRNQRQPYITTINIVGGSLYDITATASPSNGGTVEGAGSYYGTAQCTLVATPNVPQYEFANWKRGSAVVSTEPTYTFTVTGNASYVANFTALTVHSIACNAAENGSISTDKSTAFKNEIVTLIAAPSTGYYLAGWTVKDANNQPVAVTDNQFVMPDSDVTVSASFAAGFVITVAEVANGDITANLETAQPGDVVTLTATPDANCVFSAWYVFKTGDTRAVVTVVNDQFAMPAYDVTVMAVFLTVEEYEAQIGSGTSTNQYLPTRVRSAYSLSEQIYTASEIGHAGTITAIAFQASARALTRNLAIYMRMTNKTAFSSTTDWETMGDMYKVFEGSVYFNSTEWTTVTLNTPFQYDGVKNLNLCVVDNTGSAGGSNNSYTKFASYSTGSNRALYAYGSSAYTVGYTQTIQGYTGNYSTSNNQVTFTITVPGSAESIAVAPNAIDGLCYDEGNGPSNVKTIDIIGVDLNNDITMTAPTCFEISTSMEGPFSEVVTISRESKSSRNVTSWDFEGSFLDWTTIDKDGDGYNWTVSSELMSNYSNGHSGIDALTSQSYYNESKGALHPDNWLVSPQVTLGGTFTMWACAQDAAWSAEHFGVFVSTSSNTNTSSFTMLNEWTLSAKGGGVNGITRSGNRDSGEWYQFSVDLSAYAGQTGYIAVRHFNCTDMFYINVDDFVLDADANYTPELPFTLTPATVFVRLKSGLSQGYYNETLSVTTGDITSNVGLNGEVYPTLATGWNWWAPIKQMTIAELEAALGTSGILINSQSDGFVRYENGSWSGTLQNIVPGQMYRIQTSAPVSLEVEGNHVNNVTFSIAPGYNWFGYLGMQPASITVALGTDFTPVEGDKINSQDEGFAIFENGRWTGDLTTLQPGHGYVYISNANQSQSVTFGQ